MSNPVHRIRSELPGGDPTLLNRVAWARRWADRQASVDNALEARKTAKAGAGRKSRAEQGLALGTLAWQACWRGDFDDAMNHCLNAETFLPENEHPKSRAGIYATLAIVHFSRNRMDLVNCSLDRGLWLLRELPEENVRSDIAGLMLERAAVQRSSGERARAGLTIARASELATGDIACNVEYRLAHWLMLDSDLSAAKTRAEAAHERAQTLGNRVILPYLHCVLGGCDARQSRADAALDHFESGLAIAEQDKDMRARCFLLREQARMEGDRGNNDVALSLLKEVASLTKAKRFAFEQKAVALDQASVLESIGKFKQAVEQHKLAWRLQNETRVR